MSDLPDMGLDPQLLSGNFWVWREQDAERVVLYDFDNDEGCSLSLDEWRTAVAWWRGLDETKSTLAPPRPE